MGVAVHDLDPVELQRIHEGARIIALRRLGDLEAAEEAAQETVARLLEALREGRFREGGDLGLFARGIARHVVTDVLRQRGRVLPFHAEAAAGPGAGTDPLDRLVADEEATRVHEALEALSPEDRRLLRLCFYEGLAPGEVAARLGEPGTRIRKRKSRALERLRRAFFPAAGPGGPAPGPGEPTTDPQERTTDTPEPTAGHDDPALRHKGPVPPNDEGTEAPESGRSV